MPVVSGQNIIKRYEFKPILQFWDILPDSVCENPTKLKDKCAIYLKDIEADVYKMDHSDLCEIDEARRVKNGTVNYFFYS